MFHFEGWALGKDGKPTTDSKEAFFEGKGLMPLGGEEINSGYKGYGLGMLVELLCGLMSGSKSKLMFGSMSESMSGSKSRSRSGSISGSMFGSNVF